MQNRIIPENLYNVNIERAILSTIIFEPVQYENIAIQLKPEDFYHPFHQHLFVAMGDLFKNDYPIDEVFLKEKLIKKNQFDEVAFLDVFSTNPISNTNAYIKEIKAKARNREMHELTSNAKHKIETGEANATEVVQKIAANVDSMFMGSDIEVSIVKAKYKQAILGKIRELKRLKESEFVEFEEEKIYDDVIKKLEDKIGLNKKKEWDDSFDDWLDSIDMVPDEVENKKVEYLVPNLIVKNGITIIFGESGGGKSTAVVAICNTALLNGAIKRIIYLDLDNGDATIQERKIHELKRKMGQKLRYIQHEDKVWRVIKELLKRDLSDTLVVFDSAKNFMRGKDRDKNKDVSEITEIFKRLRNNGATIIPLHHTNKPSREATKYEQVYAGSSAWREDSDNMFLLTRNEYRNTTIFTPTKNRIGKIEEQAYKIENHVLAKVDDIEYAKEDQNFEEIKSDIISFIENRKTPPTYSDILNFLLLECGYSKNKANEVIQRGKGRYWRVKKIKEKNKNLFFLAEHESAESNESKKTADRCDKSDKSYFRDFPRLDNCGQVRISEYAYEYERDNCSKIDMPIPI